MTTHEQIKKLKGLLLDKLALATFEEMVMPFDTDAPLGDYLICYKLNVALAEVAKSGFTEQLLKSCLRKLEDDKFIVGFFQTFEWPGDEVKPEPELDPFTEFTVFISDEIYDKHFGEIGFTSKLELPPDHGYSWVDVTIRFVDGHAVDIKVGDKLFKKTFAEMGFEDMRSRRPDKQWNFLQLLALHNGEIKWGDEPAQDSFMKSKQKVSYTLRKYFSIEEDPFEVYKKLHSYKIKLNLIPEKK